jgi:enterochelin esterase-like enzyme
MSSLITTDRCIPATKQLSAAVATLIRSFSVAPPMSLASAPTTSMHLTRLPIAVLACAISAIVSTHLAVAEGEVPEESFDSPRLAALAKQLTGNLTDDQTTIRAFCEERQGKGPLVEPVADDPHSFWVTFLWRGDIKTKRVNVQGGPATGEAAGWMTAFGNTDLWYRTVKIPDDARFIYFFQVNRPLKFSPNADKRKALVPPRPDPLNPITISSQDGSLMELPAAPSQPWLKRAPGLPECQPSEHSIKSEILKQERTFTIYTPPNYDPKGEACRLLVLFDGGDYQKDDRIPGPVILDNLISEKKIPPFVAVFVNHIDRNKELACWEPFADFVATELVPWVQNHFHVSADAKNTIVGGVSRGGMMAAYCAFRHSETFGNVLSLSGSYGWFPEVDEKPAPSNLEPGWLTRQFLTAQRFPVRFYLAAGRFEHGYPVSLLSENRRMRDVLEAKGYAVKYSEFSGGHDYICWRSPFVEGLMALAGMQEQK